MFNNVCVLSNVQNIYYTFAIMVKRYDEKIMGIKLFFKIFTINSIKQRDTILKHRLNHKEKE